MGVRKKGRRKLRVGDRLFIWYVSDDSDSAGMVLHVVSDDRRFIVQYRLGQAEPPLLTVVGQEFPGLPNPDGCWRRFECPRWETDGIVTPSGVRRLVEWGLTPSKDLVEHTWRGERIIYGA